MRICFIIRRLDRGGAERQLLSLVKGLSKSDFEITVIEFYEGGALVSELKQIPGVERVCLNKGNRWDTFGFVKRLVQELRQRDPDIIHGYLYVANILAVLVRPFLKRRPRIVMGFRSSNTHLEHYDWLATLCSRLECFLSRFADMLIANSQAGADYCRSVGYRPRRLEVINNGIDTERFRPDPQGRAAMRSQWGVAPHQTLIGIAGRFDRKKNHPVFLSAAALFASKEPHARFVCIGGGGNTEYIASMRHLAQKLGLGDRIVWAGETKDMTAAYSALDVNTLCSNAAEGFPNVIAEAMACGVPCVATNTGDTRNIIGTCGMIIDAAEPGSIVQAWEQLLGRKELSAAARARIVDNFSLTKLAESTTQALKGLRQDSA